MTAIPMQAAAQVHESAGQFGQRSAGLCSSEEDLQQFTLAISHDLKEPLRTIDYCAEKIASRLESCGGEDTDQLLGRIREASHRMQRLIEDAIAFGLAGGDGAGQDRVEMEEVLHFACSNLDTVMQESGAVITHDRLPAVRVNFGAMVQVFQNLVSNAIKYRRRERPRIHLGCIKNELEWVFTVSDNGIGIPRQYHTDVFMALKRLHPRHEYPGTGLGLAICRRIVELHGGRMWLESVPGVGSTFYFTVPALKD